MNAAWQYKMTATTVIEFYSHISGWKEFSNFFPSPIIYGGLEYPTAEHLFQACKFVGSSRANEYADHIRRAHTPADAKSLGGQRARGALANFIAMYSDVKLRPDWDQVKDDIMLMCLRLKFTIPALRAILLSTGDAKLVEHTVNDCYWADGGNGRGLNRLGTLLMKVRAELRDEH